MVIIELQAIYEIAEICFKQCISCSSHIYNDSTFSFIAFILKPEGESDRVGTRCLIDIIE